MQNYIITKLLSSKKVWLGISSIVIPIIAASLGVDETSVSQIWWSLYRYAWWTIFSRFWKVQQIDFD
jgi:hypothetical protein